MGVVKESIVKNVSFALMIVDVDNFKEYNDTYGHMFGDIVLIEIASAIKDFIGDRGYVSRIGGDEFLVIFKDCLLDVVVNRMKKIQKDIDGENLKSKVTLSIGISEYKDGLELLDAIKRADEALYYSKKSGKKIVSVYDDIKNNI